MKRNQVKLNFRGEMSDSEEVMSLTDFESNKTSCGESSVYERIDVGIVQPYANEPLAQKSDEYEDYEEVQHGLFPVVLRDDSKAKFMQS